MTTTTTMRAVRWFARNDVRVCEVAVRPLISTEVPLAHAVSHGLEALATSPAEYLKIVVRPDLPAT